MVIGVMFSLLAGLEYAAGAYRLATQAGESSSEDDPLASLGTTLPADWDGWRRERSETQHLTFTKAMYSTSWVYRRGGEQMTVFLHRPYAEFHGMEVCYRGSGWQVRNVNGGNPATMDLTGPEELRYVAFDMDKQDEGSFVVSYVNFDFANGRWSDIPPVYKGLTLSGRAMLSVEERVKTLKNLFRQADHRPDFAVVLVQVRTTRAAEATDRKQAVERLISASEQLFAPLLSKSAK
jgi:hypothetical protein